MTEYFFISFSWSDEHDKRIQKYQSNPKMTLSLRHIILNNHKNRSTLREN